MTIPIEVLKEVSVVFTHAHCPDGMASAMILKDAFRMLGMAPRITFLAHGTPEHKGAIDRHYLHSGNGRALFCDFAPHPDVYRDHVVAGDIVLDHHVGAKNIVESFGALGVYADAEKEPGVSGAVLAFREVWKQIFGTMPERFTDGGAWQHVENFAECTGARDTWQTESPKFQRGQWISKMIMSKPAEHWLEPRAVWPDDAVAGHSDDRHALPYLSKGEVMSGAALFDAHRTAVHDATLQLVGYTLPENVRLVVFQEQASGFRLCSDVAEAMRVQNSTYQYEPSVEQVHVVAGFAYVVDKPGATPKVVYSLRGLNGFDVCTFATANGGGGHKAAAGFSVPVDEMDAKGPYAHVRLALAEFLGPKVSGSKWHP